VGLNNLINRNFPGINALNVSLVEDTEPKDYHSRFFLFLKALPSIKSDSSPTGRSYDKNGAITFKIEAERAIAMAFALEQYALGKGKVYEDVFGNFSMFADAGKSQYGGGKKSMSLSLGSNNKTNKANINIFFGAEGDKKVPFFMTPYEAHALSIVLDTLGRKCIEFEMGGTGVVIKKNTQSNSSNGPNVSKPSTPSGGFNPSFDDPFSPPTQQNQQSMNKVANDFAGFFNE